MTTATAERQDIRKDIRSDIQIAIDGLSDSALEKLASYVDYLRYEERMEDLEDEEDMAYIEAHKDEPTVPLSEVIKDYEDKYGPLD
ncbi:MAG: hypothetical protein LBP21_06890 [Synergistaceae bacterium]|jgi:hypothetical protein|nr:hypothetical protein [Synergistaceae bacterium]